jgi:spore maturation protein CgeB
MRLLHVALKYDYGLRERGLSFEHNNFYHALVNMGHDVLYFDIGELHEKYGFEKMNRRLAEVVRAEKPDLLFCVLFRYLDQDTIRAISTSGDTITLNWFCDDHYRFEDFSRGWAPCFNWVVTTSQTALPKYKDVGYHNVIKSQWACNHFLYRKTELPLKYDVTFVGQPLADRRALIESLRAAGINAMAWGAGWEAGRLSQDEMIRVFNQSRINLNLSSSISADKYYSRRGLQRLRRWVDKHLDRTQAEYLTAIKGRNFEIPGCGGFMLSGDSENLRDYYEFGKQIAIYSNADDLVKQVRYYLDHEDERAKIAQAGYERTLREHTYAHRFNEIFTAAGLNTPTPDDIFSDRVRAGETVEIQ